MSDFTKPVVGTISPSSKRTVDQRPASELTELLETAFASGVTAIVWNQYTPYFADGDPCVFSVCAEGVYSTQELTQEQIESAHAYEPYEYLENCDYARYEYDEASGESLYYDDDDNLIVNPWSGYSSCRNEGTDIDLAVGPVFKALNSGAFDDVLLNNFGDHAILVATPDAFHVTFYEHG